MNTASASATDRVKLLGVGCELTRKQPFGCRRPFCGGNCGQKLQQEMHGASAKQRIIDGNCPTRS